MFFGSALKAQSNDVFYFCMYYTVEAEKWTNQNNCTIHAGNLGVYQRLQHAAMLEKSKSKLGILGAGRRLSYT